MPKVSTAFGWMALISAAANSAHATSFLNLIDPLNPTFTQALGINGSNVVVGYGNMNNFNGFQVTMPFTSPTFTRENDPNAGTGGTQVVGIDAAGDTVGFYVDAGALTHGFTNFGSFATVDQPGTVFNQLLGINQKGNEIAGYSSATDPAGMTGQKAYTLSGGVYTSIDALLVTKFGPNFNSQATGVNNAGDVVGFYQPTSTTFSGFEDIGGSITNIMFPGSTSTQALGINDLGDIVGDYTLNGDMFGFLDVGGTFTTLDPFGSTQVTANGINDAGNIVGFYVDGAGNTIGFVSVPEPTPLLLFASGLGVLAFIRRSNSARSARPSADGPAPA
jgi:hypothetical protein